jgi:hypothetical protein
MARLRGDDELEDLLHSMGDDEPENSEPEADDVDGGDGEAAGGDALDHSADPSVAKLEPERGWNVAVWNPHVCKGEGALGQAVVASSALTTTTPQVRSNSRW